VFIGGNLISNGDFSDGTIGWSIGGGWTNNTYNDTSNSAISQDIIVSNENLYYNLNISTIGSARFGFTNESNVFFFGLVDRIQGNHSGILNNITFNRFRLFGNTGSTNPFTINSIYLINLTALGITATQEQLDFWYSVWQQNHKLGMRVHRASGNDIPLAVLNNQSLNQVFVGGQLVTNGDFSNGTTGWEAVNGVLTVVDGVSQAVGDGTSSLLRTRQPKSPSFPISTYYTRAQAKVTDNVAVSLSITYLDTATRNVQVISNPIQNQIYNLSGVFTNNAPITFIQQINASYVNSATANNKVLQTDNHYLYNLTSLGIATLTKSQLDYLFEVWQFNQVNALVARQFIQEA
jgi:hypothetical protein